MSDLSSLPPLNPAAAGLAPSKIVEVWQMGFEVDNLIALFVGEGDEPTPDFISAAATRALQEGRTFYTPKRGIPPLRQALADYLKRHFGAEVDAARITVTSSGMNASRRAPPWWRRRRCGPTCCPPPRSPAAG